MTAAPRTKCAALLDRTGAEVSELRAMAYAEAGPAASVTTRECRGWPLVARKDRLTPAERQAADGHLALCRQCRARLDEQRQNRDKIWARGGAVSAVVAADVVSLSLPAGGAFAGSGLASVVLGKAGMAIVGAGASPSPRPPPVSRWREARRPNRTARTYLPSDRVFPVVQTVQPPHRRRDRVLHG